MSERSGGFKPKDAEIVDGFNLEKANAMSPGALRGLERKILLEGERLEEEKKGRGIEPEPNGKDEDTESAYQMLQDMRWVYRKVKGREKLEKLVKGDDRHFVSMVKELMKIESALLAAKIRAKEDPSGKGEQMVFVVLKGLGEEEKKIKGLVTDIDVTQVRQALMPDGSDYQEKDDAIKGDGVPGESV